MNVVQLFSVCLWPTYFACFINIRTEEWILGSTTAERISAFFFNKELYLYIKPPVRQRSKEFILITLSFLCVINPACIITYNDCIIKYKYCIIKYKYSFIKYKDCIIKYNIYEWETQVFRFPLEVTFTYQWTFYVL